MELRVDPSFKELIPPLSAEEYEGLRQSILTEGCRDAIVIWEDVILDGHNRYEICWPNDIPFKTINKSFETREAARDWIDANQLARRNLTPDQASLLRGRRYNRIKRQGERTDLTSDQNDTKLPTAERLAKEHGVSSATIKRDGQIARFLEENPKEATEIMQGKKTLKEIKKEVKTKNRKGEIDCLRKKIPSISENKGVFDVIIIDPPWPYGTEYDPEGRRAANPYPEMSIDEIKSIKLQLSENSIIWLWTTHKFMRFSFDILDYWGLRDVAILTWVKNRIGLGSWLRSQTEFCIMAVRGKPKVDLNNQGTVIFGDVRQHSRKPDSFYDLVNSLCVGRKLDYFSRETREGFESYGAETTKFSKNA